MTQEAGSQPKEEIKLLPISEMEKMTHAELYMARSKAKTTEEQKHIAPYEHRAFAREYVEENPVTGAIGLAVAIPGYQVAKATGLHGSRTGVDSKQMEEAYKGVAEGISKAIVEPWKRVWNRVEESVQKPTPVAPAVVKPWEKNWLGRPEGKTVPPKPINRSAAEKRMKIDAQLTPAEQLRGDLYDLTDSNINELITEIKNTKDSGIKKILESELFRLQEKRKVK